ncbi:sensor histidine kinase [Streptomyces tauricus]|uniref:Sensor histidine kinase n=1 Tax=Streptomyces tauricus TaxID=68274 RepID=A0ABZ1JQK8_9ACTN|nr:sensor histidine kinase [Streptomyces tauricus]
MSSRTRAVPVCLAAVPICLALHLAAVGLFSARADVALALCGIGALCAALTAMAPALLRRGPCDAHVRRAVDVERTRIRHDLHDGLGPLLAGMALCAGALSDRLEERGLEVERALVDRIRTEVSNAVVEVRGLVDAPPPAAVASLGLVGALRDHARFVPPPTAVEIVTCALPALPSAVESAVYRIVTEAMTNVVRHADARHARVTLAGGPRSLLVTIADDGRGIACATAGVGLTSIRDRAEAAGGTLSIRTVRGSGTEVRVHLPLPRAA